MSIKLSQLSAAQQREQILRKELGIPLDATRVLVFGESSHWDTNWLRTSEEYFKERIEVVFEEVLAALAHDARRVFSIESVFFLKLYWERRPEKRELLRHFLHNRQLRLLGASLTTPDTLLPNTETILRDYLLGQQWLVQNNLALTPHTAYFPDNFGHSPALPTLMQALGIRGVGLTRIDGMYFIGSDWKPRSAFPLVGSTAEQLEREHKTLDFIWRASDGSEVICHWNAFTYFQGDMLAHVGIIRWNGKTFAIPWRSRRHIARRLRSYTKKLGALTKTPYMFCPIGCDFNAPIEDLGALLDRYNCEDYPKTGVYALCAGLDDYLELVGCHRDVLPVLAADPNPYWMGFYASRPEVKQRPMRIARTLLLAERLAAGRPKSAEFSAHAQRAWSVLSLSNHHDYITGTSPDRVWHAEQRPWLDEAEAAASAAWDALTGETPAASAPEQPAVVWRKDGDDLHVQTEYYQFTLAARRGGCLTSFVDSCGDELLAGLGNDLVVHHDTGGLWRLGHEYGGGAFRPIARASDRPAQVVVREHGAELTISVSSKLRGRVFHRTLVCRNDSPFVRMSVRGTAKKRWTVSCRFETTISTEQLSMDTPGGRVVRPARKLYDPTFWPVHSHCSLDCDTTGRRVHISFDTPGALAFKHDQALEWIVARNAPKERAFFLLPVLAHPIGGTSHEEQSFDYGLALEPPETAESLADAALSDGPLQPGSVQPSSVPEGMAIHRQALATAWLPATERAAWLAAPQLIQCSDASVTLSAFKHAEDGDGLIVRLISHANDERTVSLWLKDRVIVACSLSDAREHELAPLHVQDGRALVPLYTGIVTLRLRLQQDLAAVVTQPELAESTLTRPIT